MSIVSKVSRGERPPIEHVPGDTPKNVSSAYNFLHIRRRNEGKGNLTGQVNCTNGVMLEPAIARTPFICGYYRRIGSEGSV